MKKGLTIVALVLVAAVSVYLGANAANPPDQTGTATGYHKAKGGAPMLNQFVRRNMVAQTISGITGLPVDEIRQQLESQRLPDVLAAHNVDRKAFADGMKTRFQTLLGQLSNNGYLTDAQKSQIISRMDKFAERRALLKSLVDKGLADGTLTQEQAQTLIGKPH